MIGRRATYNGDADRYLRGNDVVIVAVLTDDGSLRDATRSGARAASPPTIESMVALFLEKQGRLSFRHRRPACECARRRALRLVSGVGRNNWSACVWFAGGLFVFLAPD